MNTRLFSAPTNWAQWPSAQSFPKYDVWYDDAVEFTFNGQSEKGLTYLDFALAGYNKDDITVTRNGNFLVVEGKQSEDTEKEYLYRGIAKRDFRVTFQLLRHVGVVDVTMDNGMLRVSLCRIVPDAEKPKVFEIK